VKKRYDPLWEIVGEKIGLQGQESAQGISCPRCGVSLSIPAGTGAGAVFCCGLCGTTSKIVNMSSGGLLIAQDATKVRQ
jgi:hypothetical protein